MPVQNIAFPVLRTFGLTAFCFVYSSVFEGNVGRRWRYRYFDNFSFLLWKFYKHFFKYPSRPVTTGIPSGLTDFDPDAYFV